MSLFKFSNSFWASAVFIFLTVAHSFAQGSEPQTVDRRALVQAAYEGFIGALYFASGNDAFLKQLSPEERQQFEVLGQAILKKTLTLGPAPKVGDGNTSNQVAIKLHFSENPKDFVIPPDKIERTAKMDGDIWFNLNMINNPNTAFSLLDAFQILFHEFGHTLIENKNQDLIDKVAAKMKVYLSSFYKEYNITPQLTAKTLVLPYLMFDGASPIDWQMEPIVLLELEGKSIAAQLNVPTMRSPEQAYVSHGSTTQVYNRLALTPKFSLYDGKILIDWFVETKNFYINSRNFNYLDLYTNNDKVNSYLPLEPNLAYKHSFQMIEPRDLIALIPRPQEPLVKIPLKTYAEAPTNYEASYIQNWIEKMHVTGHENGRVRLEAIVQNPNEIKELTLLGQLKNSVMEFPGEIEKLTTDYFRLKFSVPESNALAGAKLFLSGIAINSKIRWDLDERMEIPLIVKSTASPLLNNVQIWNEGRWQGIRQIVTPTVDVDEVKMRFQFSQTSTPMDHLEITWVMQEDILKNGENNGARFRRHQEIIPKNKLLQTQAGDMLTVEFTSKLASNYLPMENGKDGFMTRDPGLRGIISMLFVDQNLNTVPIPSRLVQNGWKSGFILTKPRPPESPFKASFRPLLCEKVF